jgi:hypothetical protein
MNQKEMIYMRYLYIICAADGCGYTYSSSYVIKDKNEITKRACENLFKKEHNYAEYLYVDRGSKLIFDINDPSYKLSEEVIAEIENIKNNENQKRFIDFECNNCGNQWRTNYGEMILNDCPQCNSQDFKSIK